MSMDRYVVTTIARTVLVSLMMLPLGGCLRFLYDGEHAPLNKQVISVTVPTDPVQPVVKPVPDVTRPTSVPAPSPVPRVDEKLLPQELPASPGMFQQPLPTSPGASGVSVCPDSTATSTSTPKRYTSVVIDQDTIWKGHIMIQGALVLAPNATLTIAPGTTIRFKPGNGGQLSRLVIRGRIVAIGTSACPIVFTADVGSGVAGSWGGIVLLATSKRNQVVHCRFEQAETAFETSFSSVYLDHVQIVSSRTGMSFRDSTAKIISCQLSRCTTGLQAYDSELELDHSLADHNFLGAHLMRSALLVSSTAVTDNKDIGIHAEECTFAISGSTFTGNAIGVLLRGGTGIVRQSRFTGNRESGVSCVESRAQITDSLISNNLRDGVRLNDGRAAVWGCDISANGVCNLRNTGRESVEAIQNWWGTPDVSTMASKICSTHPTQSSVLEQISPWLTERPLGLP